MRKYLLLFMVFASCTVMRENESNTKTDSNSIVFVVLNIRRDTTDNKHVIELVSKTECSGTIKNQPDDFLSAENYLTVYLYKKNSLSDTMVLEHPLYKHFEYLDDHNNFAVKDTVIDKADFFIRLQTQGHSNKIRIFETLKNTPREELAIIKL